MGDYETLTARYQVRMRTIPALWGTPSNIGMSREHQDFLLQVLKEFLCCGKIFYNSEHEELFEYDIGETPTPSVQD